MHTSKRWLCGALCLGCLLFNPALALAEPTPQPAASPAADPDQGDAAPQGATPQPTEAPLLLKNGSSGDEVILLQMRLRDLRYSN